MTAVVRVSRATRCHKGGILQGNKVYEGDKIDEKALKALIRAAVTLNKSKAHS
jgi:hypothetical protein